MWQGTTYGFSSHPDVHVEIIMEIVDVEVTKIWVQPQPNIYEIHLRKWCGKV